MKKGTCLLVAVALFGGTAALDIEEDYYKLLNVQQDATNPQVSPLISRTPAQKHLSSIVLFRTICFFSFLLSFPLSFLPFSASIRPWLFFFAPFCATTLCAGSSAPASHVMLLEANEFQHLMRRVAWLDMNSVTRQIYNIPVTPPPFPPIQHTPASSTAMSPPRSHCTHVLCVPRHHAHGLCQAQAWL